MITPATNTDLPQIADLLLGLHALHVDHVPHRFHDRANAAERIAFFERALREGAKILVYRTEGVVRGYLMWRLRDQPRDCLHHPLRRAQIEHIAVSPICRRRGIARRLITSFERDAAEAGCTGWFSLVHSFNGPSAALMAAVRSDTAVTIFEKRGLPEPEP